MIKFNKINYPYPVLAPGRDDYNNCLFDMEVYEERIGVTDENIEIPVAYTLNCNSIEKMVLDNKAQVAVKVKSSRASYCRIITFKNDEKNKMLKIPKFDVIGNIELTGIIVAKENIRHFTCNELNQLYFSNMTFELQKGDFLAIAKNIKIYIDDSELEKPVTSIFVINRIEEQDEDVIIDFSDEKINVNLSIDLNNMYWRLKDFNNGVLRRYLIAVLIYPALVEAIEQIKNHYKEVADDDYSEKRWFRTIELKAQKHNIILSEYNGSSVTLANELLGNISLDSLKSFKETLDQEMNDEEMKIMGGID